MSDVEKVRWGSRIGVVLAVAGSAVGLGNFLRFPGQAAQNGAGAFMIPYFIALLLVGIPLAWAEWSMGRYSGVRGFHSAPGIFASLCRSKFASVIGSLALLIPLMVYTYYVIIEAWCLGYAWSYLTGALDLGADPDSYSTFFKDFTGQGAQGDALKLESTNVLIFIGITFTLNFLLILRGLTKGIETFCKFAMPMMIVCALCVLFRVLTLGTPDEAFPERSVAGGLNYMWNPDWTALSDPNTWLAAAGQIFFSLSVGFGVIINYASYVRRKEDIALSGLTAGATNEFFEVCLGGLITLPAAFIFLGVAAGSQGTFGLGFNALPNVFARMEGGQIFGFLWFFMLFLAAITSSLSMLQPVMSFIEEGLGLKRAGAATLLGLISASGCAYVIYYSKDLGALDNIDFWCGTFLIVVLATVQSIIYGWVFGVEKGHEELKRGALLNVPNFVPFLLKFVTPVFLLFILAATIYNSSGD
ncbi:MAG: sodium-dependent transporter, partial [Planctomycetota bacterium]